MAGIGPIKARARGLSGGQVLVAVACAQMTGEDYLVGSRIAVARVASSATGVSVSSVPALMRGRMPPSA
jgi:hypothetical protein